MSNFYLITSFGTIVYYDSKENCLKHGSLYSAPRNLFFNRKQAQFIANNDNLSSALLENLFSSNTKIVTNPESFSLEVDSCFMCSEADGKISFNRSKIGIWEKFAVISEELIKWLDCLYLEPWLSESKNTITNFLIGFDDNFYLKIHKDIFYFDREAGPIINFKQKNVEVYDSEGNHKKYYKYNPVIYYCLFGKDEYFECLSISLYSLFKFGKYKNKITIISDKSYDDIKSYLPLELVNSVNLISIPTENRLFSRYYISDYNFEEFSTICYLDTDIVISDDINPILIEATLSQKFQYSREIEDNKTLGDIPNIGEFSNWFGGWLLINNKNKLNPFIQSSSGLFIFTNLEETIQLFQIIIDIAEQTDFIKLAKYGDQPYYNYVLTITNSGESNVFKDTCSYCRDLSQAMIQRTTFKHVCVGVGKGAKKLDVMQEIYKRLIEFYT